MTGEALVVWGDELVSYDLGASHPLDPIRLSFTVDLARRTGALAGATIVEPTRAGDDLLELVHDPLYTAAVKAEQPSWTFGLGTGDNPIFDRMHAASALVAGASVQAARAVWEGTALHAANIGGGLHHAMRDRASGFCVYDDPAVAIAWLLSAGAERVAYVDIDVHHGDGVQALFWDDPRVLTISVHESGATLFPGTGFPDEVGGIKAPWTALNVGLPSGCDDAGWLHAFEAVVPEALRRFQPQVLVTQHGCDTHVLDPLAHLRLTVDAQRVAHRRLHELAHEVCEGRWVATGGGGYAVVEVVPRSWTHLLAEVCGNDVGLGETPADWQEGVRSRTRRATPPTTLGDGGVKPGEPSAGVLRAVAETLENHPWLRR